VRGILTSCRSMHETCLNIAYRLRGPILSPQELVWSCIVAVLIHVAERYGLADHVVSDTAPEME
jgi:hypothetical protein